MERGKSGDLHNPHFLYFPTWQMFYTFEEIQTAGGKGNVWALFSLL